MGLFGNIWDKTKGFIPAVGNYLPGSERIGGWFGQGGPMEQGSVGRDILGGVAGYGVNRLMGGGQAQEGQQQANAYAQMMMDMKRKQMEQGMVMLPGILENKRNAMAGLGDIRSAYTQKRPSSFGVSRENMVGMRGIREPGQAGPPPMTPQGPPAILPPPRILDGPIDTIDFDGRGGEEGMRGRGGNIGKWTEENDDMGRGQRGNPIGRGLTDPMDDDRKNRMLANRKMLGGGNSRLPGTFR